MASKNFCNQKVKEKKEMPDSIISISFNKANPFKLRHIKYNIAFTKCPPWNIAFSKGFMWTISDWTKPRTEADKYIGVPMFSASLFPDTGFTHLSLPLGLLECKEEHLQQLEKNFLVLAQRMLTNISFKRRKMETTLLPLFLDDFRLKFTKSISFQLFRCSN